MTKPFVSVLLPVRGEGDDLVDCLASLAAQTYPRRRFEIIIADGSDPPIDAAIVPPGLDARILPNRDRVMSRGLNRAATEAKGDFLAIVSAHSVLPPDYLERMVAAASATHAANVGTRVRKVARRPWGRAIAAATSSPLGVGSSLQHYGGEAGRADSAFPGFIERAAFESVGGFDGRLACNEDDEFNARLRSTGRTVWYEPGVEVVYRPRESLGAAFRQHFRYGRWKVAVARLGVPGYLRWHHLVPAATVVGGVGLAASSVVGGRGRVLLTAGAAAYGALVASESRRVAPAHDVAAWRVALAFPTLHAGYGLGFIRGALDAGIPVESGRGDPSPEMLSVGPVSGGSTPTPGGDAGPADVVGSRGAGVVCRPLLPSDVRAAAALHRVVFRDYFLGHMGQRFLELFYAEFTRPGNLGFVAVADGRVVGTVIGSADLARTFGDFYRRSFVPLAVAFALRLVRDGYVRAHATARLGHVVTAVRSRLGLSEPGAPDPDAWPPAQLLSIGVDEAYRGRGIAEELTARFCAALAARGVDAVGLSVRTDNARASSFYERTGWIVRRSDPDTSTYWRPLLVGTGPS